MEQTLTPIYPTTEGLTQQRLRNLSEQALSRLGPHSLPDWLPAELAREYRLGPLDQALRCTGRHRTPIWRSSPRAATGPSIAWPSKSC